MSGFFNRSPLKKRGGDLIKHPPFIHSFIHSFVERERERETEHDGARRRRERRERDSWRGVEVYFVFISLRFHRDDDIGGIF